MLSKLSFSFFLFVMKNLVRCLKFVCGLGTGQARVHLFVKTFRANIDRENSISSTYDSYELRNATMDS